jgi:hypothetical protein
MPQCYIELRKSAARGTDSIAADMMRHLHTRQHLGKAVVITTQQIPMLSAARKQWLKLSRTIQKQRSSTLNADKILKYTYTITHMQHMRFSMKSPLEQPEADVHFLQPSQLDVMPMQCWTVYVLCPLNTIDAAALAAQLPADALVVDYEQSPLWQTDLGFDPKSSLEKRVQNEWRQVQQFLQSYNISIATFAQPDIHNMAAMDDALDTLLTISHRFLRIAEDFQRALELARPLRLSKELRGQYDAFILLAHRVQALTPNAFTTQFLQNYNEDDTFFLYDRERQRAPGGEPFAHAITRHIQAGRHHLVAALRTVMEHPVARHPATSPQLLGRFADRS